MKLVGGLLAAAVAIWFLVPAQASNPDQTAKSACKRDVLRVLHDPDSAEFPSFDQYRVVELHPGRDYDVIVTVRSRNGFNALRAVQYECTIRGMKTHENGNVTWLGKAVPTT